MLDGVLVATPDGLVVMANEAAGRLFEVPVAELLVPIAEYPRRFDLRAPDGRPELPVAGRALRGEFVPPVERLIRTGRGEKAIRTSAAPLRDARGTITGAVVLAADVTPRKAEEERARGQAARLQEAHDDLSRALADAERAVELLEHGDGFIELDRDWVIVRVNAAQERTTGKPRSETVGRVFWEVWPEVAGPGGAQWREYHRCMEQRVPVEFESHSAPFDRWFGITAYPTRSGGIAVFFRDVTARKRAEEAVLEGEGRLRAFFQNVMELAGVHEVVRDASGAVVDSVVIEVNEPALRFLGRRREEVVGRRMSEVVPPELAAAVTRPWTQVLASAAPARYEVEHAGHVLAVSASRMSAETIAAVADDITERKRAEGALRESEARFRTLTEAMPQIVCALAPDGRAEYVNPQWTAFSGLDLPRTNEAGWLGILHPDDRATAAECRRRALKTLAPQEVELRYRAADGTFRWFLSRLAPIAEGNRVVRFIGSAMNIEDRKRAEQALRETDRRRTEFLGVLSHELRNPLAPIRNSIHILELVPEGPQAARARQVIQRQTDHLARLVDDLLDATRISRGKVQLHREVVDLRGLVRRTCEDHRSMLSDAEVALHLDLPAGAVWADVDPTRIAQVIGNLLHNAQKFTPPRGAVTVRLRGRGGRAEVSVRDDGAGIDPGQVARMFEPFAQEDRSLARTRGGLGLGLALSKGLVELHGGTITARSEGAGKGSEFTISLPRVEGPAAPPPRPPASSQGHVRRRVLVIEDNLDSAGTLADVLQLEGHEVTVARNGTAGVRLARELRPDLVICDLGLPDLDGYEVARTLRADESLRSTRLVALSGYAQPEDVERAREAGFEAHLPKPAPLEKLDVLLGADGGPGDRPG
jgi:PAS domain S-box-containing protein